MSIYRRTARVGLVAVAVFGLHLAGETGTAGGATARAAATSTAPAPSGTADRTEQFSYADTTDPRQRLIATWDPALTGAPWVVTIHGGSWVAGSPAGVQDAATLFRRNGFQVFNLAYRLVGGFTADGPVRWSDQRRDVLTALAWIRAHASEFGIDADRGAIYGSSAGGNLGLAAGLTGDGDNGIRGIVSVAGVVQPTRLWDDALGRNRGERATASMRRLALHARTAAGCAYPPRAVAGCAAQWRAMDVRSALSPHDPAVLLLQGLADHTVPHQMASVFRRQLDRADVAASLTLVPRIGHSQKLALDGGRRQAAVLAFLKARTSVATAPGLTRLTVAPRAAGSSRTRLGVRVTPQQAGGPVVGRVVATAGRHVVRARLVGGAAALSLPKLAAGAHKIVVRYEGSPRLQPTTAAISVRVRR